MIYQEEINDKAVEYIKAVEIFGGELSYGNESHKELINTNQTKRTDKNWWDDEPSIWDERKKSAWDLGLMESIEVGEGCFFRVRISEKGKRVLNQLT